MLGKNVSDAVDHSKELATRSYRYYRLKIFEQTAFFSSAALQILFVGGLAFFGIVFIAIAAALYLNELYNGKAIGFVLVSVAFFLLAILIFVLRKRLENWVVKKLSITFFEN